MKKKVLNVAIILALGFMVNAQADKAFNLDNYKAINPSTQSQIEGGMEKVSKAIDQYCKNDTERAFILYQYVKEHNPNGVDPKDTVTTYTSGYNAVKDQFPKDTSGLPHHNEEQAIITAALAFTFIETGKYKKEYVDEELVKSCSQEINKMFLKDGLPVDKSF